MFQTYLGVSLLKVKNNSRWWLNSLWLHRGKRGSERARAGRQPSGIWKKTVISRSGSAERTVTSGLAGLASLPPHLWIQVNWRTNKIPEKNLLKISREYRRALCFSFCNTPTHFFSFVSYVHLVLHLISSDFIQRFRVFLLKTLGHHSAKRSPCCSAMPMDSLEPAHTGLAHRSPHWRREWRRMVFLLCSASFPF